MGKKEETTNLIGRKGSKMTVKSNVKNSRIFSQKEISGTVSDKKNGRDYTGTDFGRES